jgi:pyruvate,water dikinase
VEEPAPVLEAVKFFVSGHATNPHERQRAAAAAREEATRATLARLGGVRRALFRTWLRRAQRFAPLREDALSDVGLGWPVLRRLLRELGRRLVTAGAITSADDVFWLLLDELRAATAALDAGRPPLDLGDVVERRRERWAAERSMTPPVTLPVKGGARFMGVDFTRWMPARTDQAAGNVIKGIGASPGRVTAPAFVIRGPEEFNQMKPGGVLVARITTPAWTPLFALAKGVVTDVGGPLSHSSIVAREYHIPAVLGTGVATERLTSGQQITVDGDAGTVTSQP